MTGNIKNYAGYGVAIGIAMAALQQATPAMAFSTQSKDIFNHPDGSITNAPDVKYGLRLDAICNIVDCGPYQSDGESTFSVDTYANGTTTSKVWLDWEKSDPDNPNTIDYTTARLHGELWYNDDYPSPASAGSVWSVNYEMKNIQAISDDSFATAGDPGDAVNGWYVSASNIVAFDDKGDADPTNDTGSFIRRIGDGLTIELKGKNNNDSSPKAFIYDDDGHRCNTTTSGSENYGPFNNGQPSMCDSTSDNEEVARGWLKLKYNGYWYSNGFNDWLVVAKDKDTPPTEVSEPATMGLFGLGLLGLGYLRRRKLIAA